MESIIKNEMSPKNQLKELSNPKEILLFKPIDNGENTTSEVLRTKEDKEHLASHEMPPPVSIFQKHGLRE